MKSKHLFVALAVLAAMTASSALAAKVEVKATGMMCALCEAKVKEKLGALDGVAKVEAHHDKGHIEIELKEGASLDEELVRETVKNAGFAVSEVKMTE